MFGHVDANVLHVRPAIDMKDPLQEGLIREITEEVVLITRKYHGLLWGEHGKGVRSEFSPTFFGPLYPALQSIKSVFDPGNQLNLGKIAAPQGAGLLRIDELTTRGQLDRTIAPHVRAGYDEALQRQRRLLQLGPGRRHVPVLQGNPGAAALAERPGGAGPRMAAAARGARLRSARRSRRPAPSGRLAQFAAAGSQYVVDATRRA